MREPKSPLLKSDGPTRQMVEMSKERPVNCREILAIQNSSQLSLCSKIPEEDRFYLQMIFAYVQSKQRKVGLVVDLTNTSRFYDKSEVEKTGAKYIKLQCRGHGEAPSRDQTKTFIQICNNFSVQNPQDVIGVHCTHGFNRSGFLICAYLVEKRTGDHVPVSVVSIDMAVQIFAQARPPGIYKGHYIKDLFKQYGDVNDATPPPELPDWCTEADDEDEESPSNGGIPSASPSKGRNRDAVNENKVFMEGVKGVEIVTEFEKLTRLRRKVERCVGSVNMSFQAVNRCPWTCKILATFNRCITKSAGRQTDSGKTRIRLYMLLIDGARQNYFFDRDHTIFSAPVFKFPKRKSEGFLSDTLVDGEMITDTDDDDNPVPRFLIYDIVQFQGEEVGKMNYDVRLQCIQKEIINVRHEYMQKGWINKQQEPFSIRRKEFWDITKTKNILTGHFSKQISHETDGLIFQPFKEVRILLKWKPPSQNSVDFRLVITEVQATGCLKESKGLLYVNHMKEPFAQMPITNALKKYNKKIVECKFDQKKQHWVFMRERTDKSFPNAYTTAVAVCQSIMKPVTKDKLLDFIENHAMKPKKGPDPGGTSSPRPKRRRMEGPSGAGMMDGKLMLPPPPR
ncbi:putative mRNA-capping enzyme [Apostichopus japonicus]|uniref:mRNA-capping enzyme n=1 Tax=Stichopus japonicus TaxID=307972 RepID=A0A2G8JDR9_STIJA|nr:putative mRNA-capping enzyme [Apostichopus japonicus]